MINNADNLLFRSSQNGKIMTEPRSKSEILSETTKKYLVELFIQSKYGRKKDIENKYVTKGNLVEEDSLTLYSRFTGSFLTKNKELYKNSFIQGTPDLFIYSENSYDDIIEIEEVVDIKSSWDIFTFFNTTASSLNKDYYWQLQSYIALTGAKKAKLAYCLVNTPESLILEEKKRMGYKIGSLGKFYEEACEEIDLLCRYDDIPLNERVITIEVQRNDVDISRLYDRITICREYMNEFLFKTTKKIAA